MPLAAWRENSSRHVASLRRIRLLFFIAPVSSTITGRDYPQWTDLRKYVAELPVTSGGAHQACRAPLENLVFSHRDDVLESFAFQKGEDLGGGEAAVKAHPQSC